MAVTDQNTVYKIDENNNFLKSENREKIAFESCIFDTKNCLHVKEVYDVSAKKTVKVREPFVESDKLLTSNKGTLLFALMLVINMVAVFIGNTNPIVYYIALAVNTLGFIYFIISAFKKPKKQ